MAQPRFSLLLCLSAVFLCTFAQVGLPGGLSPVALPLADPTANKTVEFGVSKISELSLSDTHLRAYKIVEVKKQVVAGILYHVTTYMQQTTCKKTEVPLESVTPEKCPFKEGRNMGKCTFKVLFVAWQNNKTELLQPDCESYTLAEGE